MSSATDPHLAFLSTIVYDKLSLSPNSYTATPLEQAHNNNVFLITLHTPLAREIPPLNPLHCAAIPQGTSKLIFRTPKDNVSLENSVRTRNEIAFLALARQALHHDPSLIPLVYGWSDDDDAHWILEEWKAGETLPLAEFKTLDATTQIAIMRQVVVVAKCFQEFELPEAARGFGGLTFGDDGVFTNTLCVLPCGGPFATYADFLAGMCTWQRDASERTRLNGWRDVPELRARIDKFFAEGLHRALEKIPVQKATLVHADFGLPNMLFDLSTHKLTAVLDFDFSHVGSPLSEFMFSFYNLGGILLSSAEGGEIRVWMLNGYPAEVPEELRFASMFNSVLVEEGMQRPATITHAGFMSDLWWFSQYLCQAYWLDGTFVAKLKPEELQEMKNADMENLGKCLAVFGF